MFRVGWPAEAAALGVPRTVAIAVPWVELVVGALCATRLGWPVGPLAAGAMLVVFSAVLGRQLLKGHRPHCACFGGLSRRPIGPGALARNGGLLVLAALAALR